MANEPFSQKQLVVSMDDATGRLELDLGTIIMPVGFLITDREWSCWILYLTNSKASP